MNYGSQYIAKTPACRRMSRLPDACVTVYRRRMAVGTIIERFVYVCSYPTERMIEQRTAYIITSSAIFH